MVEKTTGVSEQGVEGPPASEEEPVRRVYAPSVDEAPQRSNIPRWLRFPPLSPIRRLRRMGFWPYLIILGPGIVSGMAGDDAGGIATYASAGATYGLTLLWVMLIVTIILAPVQEMCARMGAVTGKGLSDLIRERFGVKWTLLAVVVLLIANTGTIMSEFVGVAAATELFNIPRWISVPVVAVVIWWLVVKGSYKVVEKIFLAMALVFLAYVGAAFLAKPDWGQVAISFFKPNFNLDSAALYTVVALIGTSITPYMQLFVQSSVAEKGVTMRDYKYSRFDTVFGAVLSNIISVFIIVATAATLFVHHKPADSASEAALALAPIAGQWAEVLFAFGLFGASMLAGGVLPLATAYSVTESLGFEKGVSLSFREAPVFMGLFTALIIIGAGVAIIPGLPLFAVLIAVQVLNGALLPILLVFIVKLAGSKDIMERYAIGKFFKGFTWVSIIIITAAVLMMFYSMLTGAGG